MGHTIMDSAVCADCGAANSTVSRFCGTCGAALAATDRGPAAPKRVGFRGPARLAAVSGTLFVLGALVCIAVGTQIQAQGAVSFLSPLADAGLSALGLEELEPAGGSSEEASLGLALLFVGAFTVAGMAAFVFAIALLWTLIRAFRRGRSDPRLAAAQQRAAEEWTEHGRPAVAEGVRRGREGWRAAKPRLRAAAGAASRGAARASSAASDAIARRREGHAAEEPRSQVPLHAPDTDGPVSVAAVTAQPLHLVPDAQVLEAESVEPPPRL